MEAAKKMGTPHILEMENREHISITAVREIVAFSDAKISLMGDMGLMTVSGKNLQLREFSEETGEAKIIGRINQISYSEGHSGGSMLSRIFK